MKNALLTLLFAISCSYIAASPPSEDFWKALSAHCGHSFRGEITAGAKEGDGFSGQALVMTIQSCSPDQIKIPFFVGDDKSRTWVLSKHGDRIELKHDHRHRDGTEDSVTMYGGTTSNHGADTMQIFPADQQTCDMISYACGNVWWITITDKTFTYNLRRIGSDRLFSVTFDLTAPFSYNELPWGWE